MRNYMFFIVSLLFISGLVQPNLVRAQTHPCDPPNIIPRDVCGFDTFYGSPPRQLPNGWTGFVLAGDLTFMQDIDTFWGAPALRMWSNGGVFKAGVFTQVRVTPGAGYRAAVFWAAPNAPETFGRQLGIDPTGGVDPTAPTVIWGPMHWGPGRILSHTPPEPVDIDVLARAEGAIITVFFLTDHNRSTGDNFIFIDAIALYPDERAPALVTPTPIPPTETPTPTPTPVPTFTPTPTATATATRTPTPTPTPTATATSTPSATWTATASPVPTITRFPTPTSTFGMNQQGASIDAAADAWGVHFSGIAGLLLLLGLGVWIYRQ